MTTKEFDLEFDLLYDNASKGAPGLDLYEKSVFLTQAQDEIVKEAYSGFTPSRVGFEGSEKRRRQLSELVKDYKVDTPLFDLTGNVDGVTKNLVGDSQFFLLPDDLMYILQERVTLSSTDVNLNNKIIMVKPINHDDFNIEYTNPFKKPNKRKAWRLDLFQGGASQRVELFAIAEIKRYHIRYVKRPRPIILANFDSEDDLAGLGLSVDGHNTEITSELNTEIHRDILSRAVDIAILASRENSLQNKIQSNKTTI